MVRCGKPQIASGRMEMAMAMAASDIERLIRASIPDAEVTIRDLAGDGDHYSATVIAELFRGKSRVQQHQIVYAAFQGEMGGKLHALALQTGAPEVIGPPRSFPSLFAHLREKGFKMPGSRMFVLSASRRRSPCRFRRI